MMAVGHRQTLNLCIGHPRMSDSICCRLQCNTTAMSNGSIFPRKRLPDNLEGVQTVEKQTILVGGVYHRRYNPPLDTTTTNFLLKGFAIDF